MDLATLSVGDLAAKVRAGEVRAVVVVEAFLQRIDAVEPKLHAFLDVAREEALEQATEIDQKRARGDALGPLAGVPIAIKDAICTRGIESTAGSKILKGWIPPYDATVIAKLRAADAI